MWKDTTSTINGLHTAVELVGIQDTCRGAILTQGSPKRMCLQETNFKTSYNPEICGYDVHRENK